MVTPETVAAAHRMGLEMHVWTVNEEAEMRSLLALGVDGIITDFPARLLKLLAIAPHSDATFLSPPRCSIARWPIHLANP